MRIVIGTGTRDTTDVDAFLKDLEDLYRKHNMMVVDFDGSDSYCVVKFSEWRIKLVRSSADARDADAIR